MKAFLLFCSFLLAVAAGSASSRAAEKPRSGLSPTLERSPWSDPNFFPIGVWLQSPANAARYRDLGINAYVALWKGPNEAQITALKKAGLRLVCSQNETALRHKEDPMIIAWMHGDEPDNAQPLGEGKGYGPPVPPEKVVSDYQRLRATDPTRPVLLNLGQGVAWDGWHGRGVRTRHPEDYPQYIEGCDVVSFDIYPAVHDKPEIAGQLWYVAHGVQRLVQWSGGRKLVWNCLECTRISNTERKPTPHQVRAEAWMSIIHGSRGLIYFVHQFKPDFREAALLDDPEMAEAVKALNHQITSLAPVINAPEPPVKVKVEPENPQVPIATTFRTAGGTNYLFAVAMREGTTAATFHIPTARDANVEVVGEKRNVSISGGTFKDTFGAWDVRLYRW